MSKKNYIIPIFVPHMGCRYNCVFCNQKEITGQSAQPTGKDVAAKIAEYLNTIPLGSHVEVAFYGGSFTAIDKEKQLELLAPAYVAYKAGLISDIRLSTRPDCIDEEILAFLSTFEVSIIELGVQSTDEDVLAQSKRGHTKQDTIRAAELIKSWGFTLGLQMMVGLPADTPEKSYQTAQDIISLEPDFVRIYPALVVNHTQLAEMYSSGQYFPLTLGKAVEICKNLLLQFTVADINVIRIGLQPTEEISADGELLAGPFHPAFRELVESAIAREQLIYLLSQSKASNDLTISINPADTSIVRGQKSSNIAYLKEFYQVDKVNIISKDYIERGTIVLLGNDGESMVCGRKDLLQ